MVIAKTLSWAVVSGIIIGIATYATTHNAWASMVSAGAAVSLKTPFYTLHEMAWNKIAKWLHVPVKPVSYEELD